MQFLKNDVFDDRTFHPLMQKLIREQQKTVEYKNYSLFASVQLAERMLLLLVCGLVMVSCWFFAMGANQLQTASDYDLRYRYLRMQVKAFSSDFTHLDSIFSTNRNRKAILQLEQNVVNYEQALQRQAELLLQQDKIKQEQRELKKHLKKYQLFQEIVSHSFLECILANLFPSLSSF